jgi:hypothetical protein
MAIVAGLTLLGALAACGGSGGDGQFVEGSATYPLSCMNHQAQSPGTVYTQTDRADTAEILGMLKYYTANKDVAKYCDGKAPNKTDRRWAQAYVDLGAEPANVAHILNG